MSGDNVEQSWAKIDAEILALEARIRALRSSRNALTPVYRLPAEVTSEIFSWLKFFWMFDGFEHLPKYVSRHWRNIALDCGTLWSDLPTCCLSYVEEAIKRSGGAGLSLLDAYNTEVPELDLDLPPLVLSATHRLRRIILSSPDMAAFVPEWAERISQSTALQELVLISWDWATEAFFPKTLRCLKLETSLFQWKWLELPGLTELYVHIQDPEQRISLASFMKLLNQMPLLTMLITRSVMNDDQEGRSVIRGTSDSRSRLQTVNMREGLPSITHIVSQIQLTGDFSLKLQIMDARDEPITELVKCVRQHLRGSRRVIHAVDLLHEEVDSSEGFLFKCMQDGNLNPFLQILLETNGPIPYHWTKSFQSFPMDRLEQLICNTLSQSAHWRESIFKSHESLRLILLTDSPTSNSFFQYLIEEARVGKETGSWEQPIFPALSGLIATKVRFTREMKVGVKAALEAKAKQGVQLRLLMFSECNVSDDAVKQLEKVVTCVRRIGPLESLVPFVQ